MSRLIVILLIAAASLFAQVEQFQLLIARGVSRDHFGDYPGAIQNFREALALIDKHKLGDWAKATTLNSMAMSYDEMGQPGEAIHIYRRSLTLIEKARGRDSLDYATVLGNLAADYSHTGQPGMAETMLRETIAIFKSHTPVNEVRLAITQSILAPIVIAAGKRQEGEELLISCIGILEKTPGNERQLPAAYNNLGVLRREQKRYPEAIELFRKTVDVLEAEYGPNHVKLVQALNNLALGHYETGKTADAGPLLERAIAIADSGSHPENSRYGALLLNYAEYLRKSGRKSDSKQFERRGREMMADFARRNGVGQTVDIASFRQR
jgi:tetratricopeptide (TPR) repeat protein